MERKIIDYTFMSSINDETLENNIRDAILEGWQPHGSICVTFVPRGTDINILYSQAMVKYEDKNLRHYI